MSYSATDPLSLVDPIRADRHPFPVLLYLEWGLLAIVVISQLLPTPFRDVIPSLRLLALICTVGFGLMGIRLPRAPVGIKVAHALLQIGLIVLASWCGGTRGLRLFPLLCVIFVIRSCLMFKLMGRLMTSAIVYFLFLGILIRRLTDLPKVRLPILPQEIARPLLGAFAFNSALLLLLVILFVLLLVNALITERQSRDELARAHIQLRRYAVQVENLAMEQERSRIAREIHDSLGHVLTALNLQLEGALKLWQSNPVRAEGFLKQAKILGSTALQEVRRSVAAMRSDPLRGKPLSEAIGTLIQDFQRMTQIQPACTIQLPTPVPTDLSLALYRIVQESLTNICKHAQATQVTITLKQQATELCLNIQDNGQGFESSQISTGFGLQGIRERIATLGGQLKILSAPDQGCQIIVRLPLPTS